MSFKKMFEANSKLVLDFLEIQAKNNKDLLLSLKEQAEKLPILNKVLPFIPLEDYLNDDTFSEEFNDEDDSDSTEGEEDYKAAPVKAEKVEKKTKVKSRTKPAIKKIKKAVPPKTKAALPKKKSEPKKAAKPVKKVATPEVAQKAVKKAVVAKPKVKKSVPEKINPPSEKSAIKTEEKETKTDLNFQVIDPQT